MENKYFVPEISDIHIGYECEKKCNIIGAHSTEVEQVWLNYTIHYDKDFTNIENDIVDYRVPYLTNQQIEAEGWTYYQNIPDMVVPEGYIEYYKDVEWFKVVISISETSHYLDVQKVFQNVQIGNELQEFRNTIYNGECKDINTFRLIQKLLGIK